jgi:hypothetical protein
MTGGKMTNPSKPNGPAECVSDHLLLVFTNEEIAGDEEYRGWWDKGFADIQAVPGLEEGTRHLVDPDQRTGQIPTWRYMVVHGFTGDVQQLKERILARKGNGDTGLWLCESLGNFVRKSDGLPGSRGTSVVTMEEPGRQDKPEHVFMALTNAVPGRESEFHEWYNQDHVPDVVSVDCYQSGRRFRIAATSGASPLWEYLAFYRFVGSVPQMHATLQADMERGGARMTDALADDHGAWIYTAI